jgi:divalent metal cation (Fe/Co/Zn/Cd) transporter
MERTALVRRALLLSITSIVLSGLLGGIAIGVGFLTNRLSLLGFGFDAAIDSVASIVLVWRFRIEALDPERAERAERLAERAVAVVLIVLATYLAFQSVRALLTGSHPETEVFGLAISVASLVVLPLLALAKYRVARALASRALRADSVLTALAAALALLSLVGIVLAEAFGITWADSVAALAVAGVLAREGAAGFRRQGLEELSEP